MKNFIKKHKTLSIITAIIVIVILLFVLFKGEEEALYETVVVEKENIVQTVSVAGKIKPQKEASLSFEKTGKVSGIYVDVGDSVVYGQKLIALGNSDLYSQLMEAQANRDVVSAKLAELTRGTRQEEIRIYETKLTSAQTALMETKRSFVDTVQESFTKSDDVIRNTTDKFFNDPHGGNPKLSITVYDSGLAIDLEGHRIMLESALTSWYETLSVLDINNNLDQYGTTAKDNLSSVKIFLDKMALAINNLTPNSSLTQATIDTYKTSISTARTTINTAVTNLSTSQKTLSTAQSSVSLAEDELALKKAGATKEAVDAQNAQLAQAEAKISTIQTELGKTIMRSPINGIVTKVDAENGEVVSLNSAIVSLISKNKFKIEAHIPEADIGRVAVGDSADVTLDAYGDEVMFQANVVSIEPAETIIEGVATYKTVLNLASDDSRIKSGMTTDIEILTDSRDDVIAIPGRSVISNNGEKFVRVLNSEGLVEEVVVSTGIRDSLGKIEIIQGLQEGAEIIVFIKN